MENALNPNVTGIYILEGRPSLPYRYYLKKIDSTHFQMAYVADGEDASIVGDAFCWHIGQHSDRPYYADVRSWLKGGEAPTDKTYTWE